MRKPRVRETHLLTYDTGLCIKLPGATRGFTDFTCFPRGATPSLSSVTRDHSLFQAAVALQQTALYPLPAIASVSYLIAVIFYFVVKQPGGKKKSISIIILGLSAVLGFSGALTCMSSAQALHEASVALDGGLVIEQGIMLAVLLWIAASLHVLVAGYIACGMTGWGGGGGGVRGHSREQVYRAGGGASYDMTLGESGRYTPPPHLMETYPPPGQ